jgi:PAS domain S-box-containing protein
MKVLLKRLEAGLRPLPPLTITAIALGWVLLLGVADYFTSPNVTLIAFYFLAVVFAGWGAGKLQACFISGIAALTTFTVYWVFQRGVPHSIWVAAWNNTARFVVFSFTGWLAAEMTRLTRNLEQQVEQRTEQWRKEAHEHKLTVRRLGQVIAEGEQVRETLQMQATILESMGEAVVVTDSRGLIVQMNPAAEKIWGYTRCEVLGKPASVFSALPDAKAAAILCEVLEALEAQGTWRGTFSNRRKDGALISCEAQISRLEIHGKVFMVAVEQDVTARLESEHRYRSLVNNLSVGVYRNTPELDGRFIHANPALARIHGYNSTLDFEQVGALQLYENPEDRKAFLGALLDTGTVRNYEMRLKKKDGTPIHAAINATVHRDADGQTTWIDGVVEDVTERKLAEQLLREAMDLNQKMLAAATVGVSAYKASGACIFANEALARIVGGSREDLLQVTSGRPYPGRSRASWKWRTRRLTGERRCRGRSSAEPRSASACGWIATWLPLSAMAIRICFSWCWTFPSASKPSRCFRPSAI